MADSFSRDDLIEAIRMSQEQTEMQEQFGEALLRALEEKSDAEEFRTPKKVIQSTKPGVLLVTCPTCGNKQSLLGEMDPYCSKCGQALDWTEVRE